MTKNITLLSLLLGALLFPMVTMGQKQQLTSISGVKEGKDEIYTYYYSDQRLDSITTQQDGKWILKEIAHYDANNQLIKVDEWQYSTYKNYWYLATCYDYKYNKDGQLSYYIKSVYYGTDSNPLEDYEYSYDSEGRKSSIEVYDYSQDMILSRTDYSYTDQGKLSHLSVYRVLSQEGLVETTRRDYVYTEGQLIEEKVYTRQNDALELDKTLRYHYDADGACTSVEHYVIGIDYPIVIYKYTSNKAIQKSDCLPYGFPQSYFPEPPIDRYARLSEQILLTDINKGQNEYANYTYGYEQVETPIVDHVASWNTSLQIGTMGYIGIASTQPFEIDWGDGNYIPYEAGDFAQITKRKAEIIKGQKIRIKGTPGAITKLNLAQQGVLQIDLNALTALTELYLTENELTSIDLTKQTNLQQLYIDKNNISSLNLVAQKKLTLLRANVNKLSMLELSNNKLIKNLVLSDNELTTLDIQQLTELEELQADDNKLTEIDITKNVKLTDLDLDFNQLTAINLQNNPKITWLYLEGNKLADIDLSALTALRNLNLSANALTSIDLSNNTNLIELILNDNQIGQIDITGNPSISRLHVSNCGLGSLDVSNQKRLSILEANHNHLETVDLIVNERLKNLYLSDNKLQSINLSKNPKLTKLYLDNNLFKQLNFSSLPKLITVSIHHNPLDADQLNAIYSDLPDISTISVDPNIKEHKKLLVYATLGAATAQHDTAIKKGWIVETKIPEGIDITSTTADVCLKLYPNPATDRIYIENAPEHSPITLYTLDGQIVCCAKTDADGAARLLFGNLPNGYYYLLVDNQTFTVLVVQ